MIHPLFDLSGQTAVITGGSKGLGWLAAQTLADAGANVVIAARTEADVQHAADQLNSQFAQMGGHALGLAVDVTKPDSVQQLIEQTMAVYGRIHILVNSAGINIRQPITEISDANWRAVQSVNVDGVFHLCRAVVPIMQAAGYGRIINISSALGLVGLENRVSYATSKGAVVQLTRALALELADSAITVNALCPGPFQTEINTPLIGTPQGDAFIHRVVPLNRWGRLEELAPALLFLACPGNSFMTGATITIDGGWTAQ